MAIHGKVLLCLRAVIGETEMSQGRKLKMKGKNWKEKSENVYES